MFNKTLYIMISFIYRKTIGIMNIITSNKRQERSQVWKNLGKNILSNILLKFGRNQTIVEMKKDNVFFVQDYYLKIKRYLRII